MLQACLERENTYPLVGRLKCSRQIRYQHASTISSKGWSRKSRRPLPSTFVLRYISQRALFRKLSAVSSRLGCLLTLRINTTQIAGEKAFQLSASDIISPAALISSTITGSSTSAGHQQPRAKWCHRGRAECGVHVRSKSRFLDPAKCIRPLMRTGKPTNSCGCVKQRLLPKLHSFEWRKCAQDSIWIKGVTIPQVVSNTSKV